MNRSLKLSMLVALALGSSQLLAVDMGQVQVKSALGQPLLAEIPLHPASPAELQGLKVKLASSEQFARAGIVGGRTDIPLHFSVATGAHPVIRITSSEPVNDPYLDLLIEVDGKDGPSVREYAILLDPPGSHPVAATPAPAPVAAPRPASPAPRPAQRAPAPAPQAAAATRTPAPAAVENGRLGPVQSGQTLSGIARSVTPTGVDVRQMMLALQQANPDAFYRDNINALKSGAVLRVPSASEAQAMSLAAAAAEVSRQNSDWRAGTPGKPAVVADAATRASSSGSPTTGAADNEDRLALVPPQAGTAGGGQSSGKTDQSAASLREELLRSRESVASLKQQSGDLKARLKDLTDINAKNEHLLSLKDSEIAELQAKLAAARKSTGAPATAPVAASTVAEPAALAPAVASAGSSAEASESPVASASSGAATSASVAAAGTAFAPAGSASLATASATPAAAATVAAEPASAPAPAPAPARVVEQPWYMQTWAWAAAAGAVIVLILLAVLGRRRKPAAAAKTGGASLADRFGATPPAGEGDDDLLADGDTDQEQLLDQLAEHPDDIYLHLELVTLYYSRRDVERFEAAAEAMHAHITDPEQDEWQDVVHMGEDLAPGHPLFDHHAEPADVESEATRAFDIDDYADDSDAPTVVSPLPPALPTGTKKVTEYSFDFDLTQPAAGGSRTAPPAAADDITVVKPHAEPKASWDAPETGASAAESAEFSDDPVDTKLDLARAYLDMGDADGARAMLGEVLKEGSQMQRDVARKLLDGLG
ncbi:MAG: fimbrial protein FimV [Rhodanobacter sp.]|nr:fimbrial protein FimV [Rhodanobacter sp.]OJW38961.1 MAG: fimbrial protein FimV [Rhodanobacter sp. 67-28]